MSPADRDAHPVLKAMWRLERKLNRRNLWCGSGIHSPRVGDYFVKYGARGIPSGVIRVEEDGALRRMKEQPA